MMDCAKAWSTATREQLTWGAPPPACKRGPGKKTDGAACLLSDECAGNRCVGVSTASPCGVCGRVVTAGDACSSNDDCDSGLWCLSGKCMPPPPFVPLGTPCANGDSCDWATYCKGTYYYNETTRSWTLGAPGTCQIPD